MNYLVGQASRQMGPLEKGFYTDATKGLLGSAGKFSPFRVGAAATLAPFAMAATGNWAPEDTFDNLKLKAAEFGFDYSQMIRDIQNAVDSGDEGEVLKVMAQYNLSRSDMSGAKYIGTAAEGGRAMAQGGRIGYQDAGDVGDTRMAKMDMIALEFEQEHGYDMMLANPELREWYINKWMQENFYDKSEAPGEKRVMAQEGGLMNLRRHGKRL